MTRAMPMFITAVATVLLVMLFGLKPEIKPDEAGQPTAAPVATQPAGQPAKPTATQPAEQPAEQASPPRTADEAVAAKDPAPVPRLTVLDGKLLSGPQTLSVTQGATVRFEIITDRADELHVHGYDIHQDIPAGQPVPVSFVARHAGRFEFELHDSGIGLGAIEVLPAR